MSDLTDGTIESNKSAFLESINHRVDEIQECGHSPDIGIAAPGEVDGFCAGGDPVHCLEGPSVKRHATRPKRRK